MALSPDEACTALGRPRSTEADEAIAHAALALLGETGFEGVTVEAVAARAGVAKSTVYRRYPGKPELLVEVIRQPSAHPWSCPTPARRAATSSPSPSTSASRSHAPISAGRSPPWSPPPPAIPRWRRGPPHLVAARRSVVIDAIERGIERGEIDPDVDPELLIDMIVGPSSTGRS